MGMLDWLKGKSIVEYVAEAQNHGVKIIDVREAGEFEQGHVPGAVNMPLRMVAKAAERSFGKDDLLYLYCQSGMRSSQACRRLKAAGFTNAVNIGGIGSYRGPLER